MNYERLLDYAHKKNIVVKEKYFKSNADGLCKGNVIGISKRLSTSVEKRCILAEELGHYFTTVGDITDQSKVENRKQERKARTWGYDRLIPIHSLVEAINYQVQTRQELADYLDVTEETLEEALRYYKQKYGLYCQFNEYTVWFEPLRLMKKF